ncbi:MAG TPA: hypothetical protein VG455_05955 [Acidimicrobiales bacterium]|nr:hypothetical protein [Acidimicrobiales bacterium]
MTDATRPGGPPPPDGSRTASDGTPVAVDVSRDRLTRVGWVVLLGGPVIWFSHFMLVYLVAEAGCTGGGPGLRAFDPPVPSAVTMAATAVAAVGCLAFAVWAHRRWIATRDGPAADDPGGLSGAHEEQDRGGTLAFASLLLSLFSFVAVLFVGLPALVLEC